MNKNTDVYFKKVGDWKLILMVFSLTELLVIGLIFYYNFLCQYSITIFKSSNLQESLSEITHAIYDSFAYNYICYKANCFLNDQTLIFPEHQIF